MGYVSFGYTTTAIDDFQVAQAVWRGVDTLRLGTGVPVSKKADSSTGERHAPRVTPFVVVGRLDFEPQFQVTWDDLAKAIVVNLDRLGASKVFDFHLVAVQATGDYESVRKVILRFWLDGGWQYSVKTEG